MPIADIPELKKVSNAGLYCISPEPPCNKEQNFKLGRTIDLKNRLNSYHLCYNSGFYIYCVLPLSNKYNLVGTDNRANTFPIAKFMTTKFPLSAVLMEESSQLQRRDLQFSLGWLPREADQPADVLTNGKFDSSCLDKRKEVLWENIPFLVLRNLL